MRTIVWLVGVAFVALGAVLLFAPTFGFETIAADRTADVETSEDEHALVGFEPTGDGIDAPDDQATVFRLRNNAGESLTLSNSHRLSIDGLAIDSTGEGTVEPGGHSAVSVYCGDYRGTDTATLAVTVDEARGTSVSVTGASSVTSFLADCDVPAIVWNATADWDAGTDDRTVSDDVGDRVSDTVRLGYGPNETGLVGYWPLDGDSGPAVDASGNGNDGTLHGDPTTGQTGILDSTSYDFDGDGDYVNVSHDAALELSDENRVTVSAWVKKDSQQSGWTAITQKSNTGYNLQFANGNQPTFTISSDDNSWVNAYADTTVSTGEWHHLVGTYDGTNLKIYVDGRDATEGSPTASSLANSSDYGVGIGENLENTGRELDGDVDEVRIYDRALSATEVQNLYYTADNGTHTTDWRSTSVDLYAERLVLQNVSATLGTTDATVYVESDPDHDGVVNETSDPIALSETVAEYDVTGIANDTDRVRLRAEFETGDVTRTPILSRADLAEVYSNFTVSIDGTNEPVLEGEELTVDATVENVGSDPDTQTVELRDFDGNVVDSTEVQLDARSSTSTTLAWNTQTGDNGAGNVTVASDDDTASHEVTVKQQATFDVAIDATNSPVKETEDLDVDVTVQNVGDVAGEQTVELQDFGGNVVDSTNVSLDGGETNGSITLTWNTQDGENGTADVTVASEDDTATREVTVDPLHLIDSCTTFDAEGTWRLTANVSHGGSSDCFDSNVDNVTFEGQGHTVDMDGTSYDAFFLKRYDSGGDFTVRNVTVDGGDRAFLVEFLDRVELRNVTIRNASRGIKAYNEGDQGDDGNLFVHDSAAYDVTNYVVQVTGDGVTDLYADRFTIGDPAGNGSELDFDLHESGSATELGETSSPTAAPDGNVSIGAYFELLQAGDPLENVTLYYEDGDVSNLDEATIALWRDDGSWTQLDATVDAASNAVTVGPDLTTATDFGAFASEPPAFGVAVDSTNSPVTEGEDLEVTANVTNNGDATDTQTVELADFDGNVVDQADVQVAAGATETVTLNWSTTGGDEGTGDVTVASPSDTDTAQVEVQDGSSFDVTIDQAHDGIVEGEDLDVDVNVTNDGAVTDTETVELERFDGTVVDSTDVTLDPGETNSSVTLTWSTTVGDNGTDEINVTSDADVATQQVTIDQQATFDVAIAGANDPVMEGEDLTVDANVTNVGDRSGTQTVALEDFGGQQVDATNVTLAAGETNSSITLVWSTGSGDGGTDDVTVRSEDTSDAQTVQIEQPAYFDVAINGTNSPVEEGQTLTVDVNVTNTGDYSGTQTVALSNFSGAVVDSTDVTLGAGETNSSITLNWSTTEGDAGSGDVTVASENTSDARSVTVETAGLVSATNVAPNVSSGQDTQYFEMELTSELANDYVNVNVSEAENSAQMDYGSSPSITVENGGDYVASTEWIDYGGSSDTGPRLKFSDQVSGGETVTVSVSDYSTQSSGGPWTVDFVTSNTDLNYDEADDFEIE